MGSRQIVHSGRAEVKATKDMARSMRESVSIPARRRALEFGAETDRELS